MNGIDMKNLLLILLCLPSLALSKNIGTLVYDMDKNDIIVGSGLNEKRPIASLTKIMTAMVALDHDGDLKRKIKISGSNKIPGGEYTREELLTAMLVRSDNAASEALAADYPGGRKAFIRAMNAKAENIGMTFTRFADPSGLSSLNLSNPVSVGIMLQVSSLYPFIRESSVKKQVSIKKKNYSVILENTNRWLLYDFDEIVLSKTGYTSASGWSVGVILEKEDRTFSVVVLGAPTREKRYEVTKDLILKYFDELALEKSQEELYNKTIWQKIKDWMNWE